MPTIRKLLIANRGEIAVRIIRACRELGVATVAVYAEADRDAPFASMADEAYLLGPSPATESYLRSEAILSTAGRAGADAIHPGYGFLSENAEFAQACVDAGLTFVGPPPQVIRLLGDKIRAKELMAKAGVPLVPGYFGDDQSDARLQAEAEKIESPVLIKAAAGGGGRGMRIVRSMEAFQGELEEARRESKAAFGDDRVLLEKYVERPRHVEVQIMGDSHGKVVHLFERECSVQRRHQKIIEESPSPVLLPDLRGRMAEAAEKAGQAAGYVNAGTVEFLLEERPDGDHRFYFLEVNTRLQVEHPVTETLTGIDLVKLQVCVAQGEPLGLVQEDIHASGHAIEARIYAEDPATGFLPSIGRLEQWIEPTGPWVRVDSGVERGGDVSPYYDPMLAKVIVRGETRQEAITRLVEALRQFHVLGIRTNIAYLIDILTHPEFVAGRLSTSFLDEQFKNWQPEATIPPEVLLALAAEAMTRPVERRAPSADSDGDLYNPWRVSNGWRNAVGSSL
jgi:3-methylcrotonyl-CoA carboxylase alpha subunit